MTTPLTVTTRLDLRLLLADDRALVVPCHLAYDSGAPYELTATFETGDDAVTWVFARDLVRDGMTGPSGLGDVVVWPSRGAGGEVVCLALSSPSGRALLEADRAALADFLRRTDEAVPPGSEPDHLDVDGLLSALLAD